VNPHPGLAGAETRGPTRLSAERRVARGERRRHDRCNHALAFCLPLPSARRGARTVITELGPDPEPLRDPDRAGVLFDLGLGTPTVDVCVRSSDPDLVHELRAACGAALFGSASWLVGRLVAAGPHRVFLTACGRVEVYAAIPPPEGRSPDGPHTHLLPEILRAGRTHPATVPVPTGYAPSATCTPEPVHRWPRPGAAL
jgi:hypothetical protein